MDNLKLHEKIKNENIKAQQQAQQNEIMTNLLLIVCFPFCLILFLILGLGCKKE